MDDPRQNRPSNDYRNLVKRIIRGKCVLILGPRVAVRPNDSDRRPFDELLACELLEKCGASAAEAAVSSTNLRRAADLYLRDDNTKVDLEMDVGDFYARFSGVTTDFHRDLAALPFLLCVHASPDDLMSRALEEAGKAPQRGYYGFHSKERPTLLTPTVQRPLVYHLFGHHTKPESLVLTEGDLIEFIVAIVKGVPPVPDQVRSFFADKSMAFIFLGFGFQHWYLRVLVQVLDIYSKDKVIAFEDQQFFERPEHEETVGFFSGDREIDFRPLQWEQFARELREAYEAMAPAAGTVAAAPAPVAVDANAPKVFLSYASEDHQEVDLLADQLQARGIRVWQDTKHLRAGDNWNNRLEEVIKKNVDYVVVVQTQTMCDRNQGVYHREIKEARIRQDEMGERDGQRLKFLIPVRVGPCPLLSTLDDFHVIDIKAPGGIDSLVGAIEEDWQRRTPRAARTGAVA